MAAMHPRYTYGATTGMSCGVARSTLVRESAVNLYAGITNQQKKPEAREGLGRMFAYR